MPRGDAAFGHHEATKAQAKPGLSRSPRHFYRRRGNEDRCHPNGAAIIARRQRLATENTDNRFARARPHVPAPNGRARLMILAVQSRYRYPARSVRIIRNKGSIRDGAGKLDRPPLRTGRGDRLPRIAAGRVRRHVRLPGLHDAVPDPSPRSLDHRSQAAGRRVDRPSSSGTGEDSGRRLRLRLIRQPSYRAVQTEPRPCPSPEAGRTSRRSACW